MKRIMNIGLGFVFGLSTLFLTSTAGAQTASQSKDQSSLADYARRVRKDTGAPKTKPKVFDNDNLPMNDKLSVVGQQPVTSAEGTAPAQGSEKLSAPADSSAAGNSKAATDNKTATAAKPAGSPEEEQAKKQAEWKSWQDKLTAQRDKISLASRELDVTQREYQLRAAAMYADAGNRLRNSAPWDKEETNYKQQIAEKQKALDDAKQKLEDMKEEAHKADVPSSITE